MIPHLHPEFLSSLYFTASHPIAEWPDDKVKWSGPATIPMVGSTVRPLCPYRGAPRPFGLGTVQGYAIEHGFLYLIVDFPKMPLKYQRDDRYQGGTEIWVAGVDLLPRSIPTLTQAAVRKEG